MKWANTLNFGKNINVKVDLSNYATKPDINNISHVDTLIFALDTNLATLTLFWMREEGSGKNYYLPTSNTSFWITSVGVNIFT